MAGLVRAATILQRTDPTFHHGPIATVIGCQPILTEKQQRGLALTTTEGFDSSMTIDAAMLDARQTCIAERQAGIRHDGPVHEAGRVWRHSSTVRSITPGPSVTSAGA